MSSGKYLALLMMLGSLATLACGEYIVPTETPLCLLMDIDAHFEIQYEARNNQTLTAVVRLPNDVKDYNGTCVVPSTTPDSGSVQIEIRLPGQSTLSATFVSVEVVEDGQLVNVSMISKLVFSYNTEDNPAFVDPIYEGTATAEFHGHLPLRMHQAGHCFQCHRDLVLESTAQPADETEEAVGLLPLTFRVHSLKLQAFQISNFNFSQSIEECGSDTNATTTSAPVTSTPGDLTTTTPAYAGNYSVQDASGNVCLLIQFRTTFHIPYATEAGNMETAVVEFNGVGVNVTGQCGEMKQEITLQWRPRTDYLVPDAMDWQLVFALGKNQDNEFFLGAMSLWYYVTNHTFPNNAAPAHSFGEGLSKDGEKFKAPAGDVYRCNANQKVHFAKVNQTSFTMELTHFRVEAFRNSTSKDFSSNEVVCAEDNTAGGLSATKIVLIVLAVLLSLLLLVTIGAYFFVRRRQRQSYQRIA